MMQQVRRYRARRFEEALAEVRRDLGPDALVLSSRQVWPRAFPVGRPEVELTAAPPDATSKEPDHASEPLRDPAALLAPIRGEIRALRNAFLRTRTEEDDEPPAEEASVLRRHLARQGVPEGLATALERRVLDALGRPAGSLRKARTALRDALEAELVFAGPVRPARRGPRIVALVGPTGVGKTTTVAKIAARASLVDRRRVVLVSVDRFRVGGADQLRRYADLIGIPLEIADGPDGFREVIERSSSADLVLVDTAGRAPRDAEAIQEMARILHAPKETVEVHLLLAAATREVEAQRTVQRLSPSRPSRLTVTKLDEAATSGGVLAAQSLSGLPYAYFTTGQRVPEDIEDATADRLAALLTGIEVN